MRMPSLDSIPSIVIVIDPAVSLGTRRNSSEFSAVRILEGNFVICVQYEFVRRPLRKIAVRSEPDPGSSCRTSRAHIKKRRRESELPPPILLPLERIPFSSRSH
jgi:hypothetical protein